ncbi:MAG: TonB-dependent receptor, partial [Gemmatimonadota bacterium]
MSLRRGHRRSTVAPVVIGALAMLPLSARAQARCETIVTGAAAARGESWAPPLGRPVTVHADGISLREALAKLASSAGVRITYSADGLPLDRTVCIAGDSARIGDLLVGLLRGLAVEPMSAGTDLVVLAAVRTPPAAPTRLSRPDSVVPLEPVIVDAPAADPARRELPVVPGVLESYQLGRSSSGSLSDALNGTIPGVWIWNASTSGLMTQYASVRGATSFGMSAPKVYIDGIEVANPYLLTRIPADAIERIEVIRGPQGAALYGADAISGVTNIITRHGAFEAGAPRFRIRSRFGLSSTDYPAGSSLAQDHNLGLQLGSDHRSAAFNLSVGTEGDFIPGASSRHIGADGSIRFVGASSLITGTLRYSDERTRSPLSPVLSDSVAGFSSLVAGGAGLAASTRPLDLQQFTAGMRASWTSGDYWTHTAVAGVDGYALSGDVSGFSAILSPADSALRAAGAGAVRGTLRMSSTASTALGRGARGAFTFAAEHTMLRQFTDGAQAPPGTSRSSTGISAQADVALHDRLFLTGGLRLEHNGTLESSGLATLPMLGGSWIASTGPVGLKLRAAYGRGIRWPDLTAPQGYWEDVHEHLEHIQLGPEMQTGVEGGFDVTLGRALLLQVTRFDQTASGLVQRVAVANGPRSTNPGTGVYGGQGPEGYGW